MRVLQVQKKRHAALVMTEDGGKWYFPAEAWTEYGGISEGDELDDTSLADWLLPRQYPEALAYAVSLLAQRDRAGGEIQSKLLAKNYLPDTAEMVVYKLQKERLLNDEAFCARWISARSRAKIGKNRIRRELLQKGISREMADSALLAAAEDEETGSEAADAAAELALRLLHRYEKDPDPYKAMNKLLAAMARRGYGYEESKAALQEAIHRKEQESGHS